MATGPGSRENFVIYDEEYMAGMVERLARNLKLFNGASNGAVSLRSEKLKGDYVKESYFDLISNPIAYRDPTDVSSSVDDIAVTMAEHVAVKVNRRIGPIAQSLDAWRKNNQDPARMSFVIGQQIADYKMKEMIDNTLGALVAAIEGVETVSGTQDLVHDSSGGTIETSDLADAMAKMGDAYGNLGILVMHGKVFFDLVKEQISTDVTNIGSTVVFNGSPVTMGKPVIVMDSPSLKEVNSVSGGSPANYYKTLFLPAGAAEVIESESEIIDAQVAQGKENLLGRLQGEYAYTLGLKGFAYNSTSGGANPTASALATSTNWTKIATSIKDLCGVVIKTA